MTSHQSGSGHDLDPPLEIGWIAREEGDSIEEGALYCTSPQCRAEYPIVDGLPVLVPDPRAFIAENILHFIARDDLDARVEALLGECCGPGSAVDATRLHLSTYAWDHYGEFDPDEAKTLHHRPGSIVEVWRRLRDLSGQPARSLDPEANAEESRPVASGRHDERPQRVLEIGCSVGRIAFEEAQEGATVLGIDTNVAMLRLAQRAARTGVVVYPRRRQGLLYDRREFSLRLQHRERADFWIADGTVLPFPEARFQRIIALNVLDATPAPLDLLRSMANALEDGGEMLLATPFDWSGAVTAPSAWIGGHSPRAAGDGAGPAILKALLTPGAHSVSLDHLRVLGEIDRFRWTLRTHERSMTEYQLYGLAARVERHRDEPR
jgi:SAM-dependent methyltransferase/uncharacterized protein YbaR (Trm112 family)